MIPNNKDLQISSLYSPALWDFFIIFQVKFYPMALFKFLSKDKKESLDKGLEKTKHNFFQKIGKAVAGKSKVDDEVLDELEEVLITSDVGVDTTIKIINRIEERVARDKYLNVDELNIILKEEIAALLNEVEKIARGASVEITDIKPRPTKEMLFYKKYLLEMDCQATMEKHIEFIYNLQQSKQLIRVERLKLSSQGKNNPLLKANMSITKVSVNR